jgi:hypothetical protein
MGLPPVTSAVLLRGSRGISCETPTFYLAIRSTADVTGGKSITVLQAILGVSPVNPLAALL